MKKILNVETHENISLEYETANLGSRAIAFILDNIFQYLAILILILISVVILIASKNLNYVQKFISQYFTTTLISAVTIVFFLMSSFVYYFVMELFCHGQTLGKKIAKIKVVSTTGEPINLLMCLIRNLLRLVDILPAANLLGCIFIILNKNSQRIGDIAANTTVIKTKRYESFSKHIDQILSHIDDEDDNKQLNTPNSSIIEYEKPLITEHEYKTLKQYVKIKMSLNDYKKYDIRLYKYFIRKTQLPPGKTFGLDMFSCYLIQMLQANEKYYEN